MSWEKIRGNKKTPAKINLCDLKKITPNYLFEKLILLVEDKACKRKFIFLLTQ